jgi:hypothetical protein
MFGLVVPEKPEMKVKEYEQFSAIYCGICKSIARRFGTIPRFVLNYDLTFLAVLLSSVLNVIPNIEREHCFVHPLSKRSIAKQSEVIDYAADMNILLAYHKLRDDWEDERKIKSIPAMAGLLKAYKKVKKLHPEKEQAVRYWLSELNKLEKQSISSLDAVAEPFAKLMEVIFLCDNLKIQDSDAKILSWIGYNLGKWIYTLDAYSDIEKDLKDNSYNPFILRLGRSCGAEEIKKSVKEEVEFILVYTLSQISKSYELLKIGKFSPIVENIIYLGMLRKTESILGTGSCDKIEKSI